MSGALILIAMFPFGLAVAMMAIPPLRGPFVRIAPLTAVPALVVSLAAGTVDTGEVPWLLLETLVGLDTTARVFLFLSGLLWGFAGWYARAYIRHEIHEYRFHAFYLLAMSGNFGLILAQDLVTFYASFALMTFSSAGLIVHDATREAVRATSVYIILAIIGEFLLLVGLFQAAMDANSLELALIPEAVAMADNRDVTILFLLTGFGIKVGAPVLHMWLPLAHPAAPTPASAVLSGVMIKAGLLGWIRFVPGGFDDFVTWGWLCVGVGMFAAFAAVLIGLVQENPKVTLAYSSVSQMGIMTTAFGIGLIDADAWPAILAVLVLYVLHHGMAKGALFLGVGIADTVAWQPRARIAAFAIMAVAALALAGAPLTSGALAKGALKDELGWTGEWSATLTWVLAFSSTATTLLMARFMAEMARAMRIPKHMPSAGMWAPWLFVVGGALTATWAAPAVFGLDIAVADMMEASKVWGAVWPVLLGAGIAAAGWWQRARLARYVGVIPPGDVVKLAEIVFRRGVRPGATETGVFAGRPTLNWGQFSYRVGSWIGSETSVRSETRLASWRILGVVLLAVMLGLVGLLSWHA